MQMGELVAAGKLDQREMLKLLPAITPTDHMALSWWGAMGNTMDWPALAIRLDLYDVDDPEDMIGRLEAIAAAVRENG